MKVCKSILAGISVAGLLGFAPASSVADDPWRYDSRRSIEDDSSLAPNVPGVTEDDHMSNMTQDQMREVEQALSDSGYNPGPIDGMVDDQTRAALRDFQEDRSLAATGIIDAETGELLAIVITETS